MFLKKFVQQDKNTESKHNINDRFNGAYYLLLDNSMNSLVNLLQEHIGKSFTNIPVGVGLLDIELNEKKFSYVFHYKNKQNEWETSEEEDNYSNMRYHFQSFFRIMENGYVHNDFGKDIKDHLPNFLNTFIELLEKENSYGVLPTGEWCFYYGSVCFKISRRVDYVFNEYEMYTNQGIYIINGKHENDSRYDCGFGGGGAHKRIFNTDWDGNHTSVKDWTKRIDQFIEFI